MSSAERGFSLLEVLVALALVAAILLFAAGFYWQSTRVDERLAAQRRADAALAGAYELMRAGALPLADGEIADPTGAHQQITATVSAAHTAGLAHLELVARYEIHGAWFRRTLEALVYAP
jgi:prepilin-type N-terminal cleavage/methylation domain-containing protein